MWLARMCPPPGTAQLTGSVRARATAPLAPKAVLCATSGRRPGAERAANADQPQLPEQRSIAGTAPAQVVEGNESLLIFVPQDQPDTTEALPQGQPADAAEGGMLPQHQRQPVVGDPAAQMMDVVHADIGGEPPQDGRQLIVGAAVQSRFVQIPGSLMGPSCVLELVLDIKQPDPDRGGEQRYWKMHEQERADAHQ